MARNPAVSSPTLLLKPQAKPVLIICWTQCKIKMCVVVSKFRISIAKHETSPGPAFLCRLDTREVVSKLWLLFHQTICLLLTFPGVSQVFPCLQIFPRPTPKLSRLLHFMPSHFLVGATLHCVNLFLHLPLWPEQLWKEKFFSFFVP